MKFETGERKAEGGRIAAKRLRQAVGWDRYLRNRWAGLNVA